MVTKVTLRQDGDGNLRVYDAEGQLITGIDNLSIDHDAETGTTYISIVRQVDLEISGDLTAFLLDAER